MGRYWFVIGGTGSVWGSTGWYLVVLGQFRAALVDTFGTGSVKGGTGRYLVVLGQYGAVLVGS